MADGLDSPSLRILAGIGKTDPSETRTLFEKALRELNIEIPTLEYAAELIVVDYCEKIISGRLTPLNGTQKMVNNVSYKNINIDIDELLIFVGLLSEYDDFGDDYHIEYYGEEHCKGIQFEILERIKLEANNYLSSKAAQ